MKIYLNHTKHIDNIWYIAYTNYYSKSTKQKQVKLTR